MPTDADARTSPLRTVPVTIERFTGTVRVAPWWLHILAIITLLGTMLLMYWLVEMDRARGIPMWSSQWSDRYFFYTVIVQCLRIGVVLFLIGRLRPIELGIDHRLILPGIITLAVLWVVAQLFWGSIALLWTGEITPKNPLPGLAGTPGFKALLLGSPCEELLMRGFFMLQFYLIARARSSTTSHISAAVSIAAAAMLFASLHIPRLIMYGALLPEVTSFMFRSFLVGIFLGIVFARSGNIFVAMGLHCYVNLPFSAVVVPVGVPYWLLWGIELLVIVIAVHVISLLFRTDPGERGNSDIRIQISDI
jgi:membrane protease YdiL (CAAX protease family)